MNVSINRNQLKYIAIIAMLIDHIAYFFPAHFKSVTLWSGSNAKTLYWLMRSVIGRLAFPIYCFLLVEGFLHTKDRKKYAIRLLIFSVISEIPWNLSHTFKLFYRSQNVFFTLFLGLCGMWIYEHFSGDRLKQVLGLIALLAVSALLKADYGMSGFGFIMMMYALRKEKLLQAAVGCCFLSSTWFAGLAFIPINLYDGKRGFIKGKVLQYAYYAIYPVHLFIIYLITK